MDNNSNVNSPLSSLTPLSEEHIAEHNVELFDLWMVKDENGTSWGPYETKDLKELSDKHEDVFEHYTAFNIATEKEKPFFQNTKFQRRKPKLVSLQGLKTIDEFYLLFQGIKKGPFSLAEVKEMHSENKISLNVMASVDKGESWIKLFEHHEFDRRLLKNKEELPFSPTKEVLDESKTGQYILENGSKIHAEQDAIVGLAFIGHGNDKGQRIKPVSQEEKQKIEKHIASPQGSSWSPAWLEKVNKKYVGIAAALILVIFTGINSFNTSFDDDVMSNTAEFKKAPPVRQIQKTNTERKPAKVIKAKKYKPLKRKPSSRYDRSNRREPSSLRRMPKRRPAMSYRQVHTDERYDRVDLDDPEVERELSEKLGAGDLDRNIANDELSEDEIDFIERAESEELSDEELDRYQDIVDKKHNEFEIDDFE